MKRDIFWLVWNPQGRAPTHKHITGQSAHDEAKRLAMANPGQEFYVMKAIGGFGADMPKIKEMKIRRKPSDGGIPW